MIKTPRPFVITRGRSWRVRLRSLKPIKSAPAPAFDRSAVATMQPQRPLVSAPRMRRDSYAVNRNEALCDHNSQNAGFQAFLALGDAHLGDRAVDAGLMRHLGLHHFHDEQRVA